MTYEKVISTIDGMAAVRAVNETLRRIDVRLVDHGERVAFIASQLNIAGGFSLDEKLLQLLSVFHDIGAYKTDEIDKMVEFETDDVKNHSVYGYLFIKHLTPLKNAAKAILYHHSNAETLAKSNCEFADYAGLIHIADRIDIALTYNEPKLLNSISDNKEKIFMPLYVKVFNQYFEKLRIKERIDDGSYRKENFEQLKKAEISSKEALDFLRMIVFSIDFRSENTVTHTINTVSISMNMAQHFGLSDEEKECIYLGALLHDVGKIAIPYDILEFPGRLSDEQMAVMRTHVTETEKIITGIVPDSVLNISARHHEKLDGTGYPRGLSANELDMPQRIVAIADIVSALGTKRSYKEVFPKEKTLAVIGSMRGDKLDEKLCDYVCDSYDEIIKETDANRDEVITEYCAIMGEYKELAAVI